MLVGIIALSGIIGFVVAGGSLLLGGSVITALWLYPTVGIFCTLAICLARYSCGNFKARRSDSDEYSRHGQF